MAILGIPEAKHFCRGWKASTGQAQASFRNFSGSLGAGRAFSEGTIPFDEFRDCSLREVERLLFLSMCLYRRSLDLLIPSAASWSHVTMYYATFYSASGLLGMFGNWQLPRDTIIDVVRSSPGNQQLVVARWRSTYGGTHKAFWDLFYTSVGPLLPWVDPAKRFALLPVSGSATWLSDTRNEANYDSHQACALVSAFQRGFRKSRPAASLPGVLNTQHKVLEGMLSIAVGFAKEFGIATDALNAVAPMGTRKQKAAALLVDELQFDGRRLMRRRLLV